MMPNATNPAAPELPLLVTMGEPAGVGPELTLKAWLTRETHHLPPFGVIADDQMLRKRADLLAMDVPLVRVETPADIVSAFGAALPVLSCPLAVDAIPGQPDARNASSVIAAIERAVAAVAKGEAGGIVTNPIAKSVLYDAGFAHPGHTEFLGQLATRHWPEQPSTPIMLLASDDLRVIPLTVHVPIKNVPALITGERLRQTVEIFHAALRDDFGCVRPRISVAGLNPHAGEQGTIGEEDRRVIAPTLDALRSAGYDVSGPLPADTMFHQAARATYDGAIAMYHDQALIPIKTLAFDRAVNLTLGLPFIRTSPDHGTAFDIAGQDTASATSLIAALRLAREIASCRRAPIAIRASQ